MLRNPFSLRGWLILLYAALVVLALVVIASWWARGQSAKTAKAEATIAAGRTASAVETIDIIADNAAATDATHEQVKDAQDAIRAAPPADRERVARQRLCQLQGRSPC